MVSVEETVTKTELVGKTTIKAQLGDEIKRLSIHNDDLTYDELILMLQRVFKTHINKEDDLSLKYRDEDGDLITLSDNLDLNTALEATSILKITIFVHSKEFCLETSEVKKIRYELQDIRNRVNHLLDSLEYKKGKEKHEDDIKGKYGLLEQDFQIDKGKPKVVGSDKSVVSSAICSKEFDPYLQKDREEIEGRPDESELVLSGSRAPPSGSSVINNLLRPPNFQSVDQTNASASSLSKDIKAIGRSLHPSDVAMMNGVDSLNQGRSEAEQRQSPSWPPKIVESTKNAPQILPTVQHAHLPPSFNPPQHQTFMGPISTPLDHQQHPQPGHYQPHPQVSGVMPQSSSTRPGLSPISQFGAGSPPASISSNNMLHQQGPPTFKQVGPQSYPPLTGLQGIRNSCPPMGGFNPPPSSQVAAQMNNQQSALYTSPGGPPPPTSSTSQHQFRGNEMGNALQNGTIGGVQSQYQSLPPLSHSSQHQQPQSQFSSSNGPPINSSTPYQQSINNNGIGLSAQQFYQQSQQPPKMQPTSFYQEGMMGVPPNAGPPLGGPPPLGQHGNPNPYARMPGPPLANTSTSTYHHQ